MNSGLTIDIQYKFEAAHRLTSSASAKCQTPHGHTWFVKAFYTLNESRFQGQTAMAAEFGALKRDFKIFVDQLLDHSFLVHFNDPMYRASKELFPDMRSLEFPCDPTTEAIAAAFALKLKALHQAAPSDVRDAVRLTGIRIQETQTNAIELRWNSDQDFPIWANALFQNAKGWWTSQDPLDRSPVQTLSR